MGASHCAPSGPTALSVTSRTSPCRSWRPDGNRSASRLSVVHSADEEYGAARPTAGVLTAPAAHKAKRRG